MNTYLYFKMLSLESHQFQYAMFKNDAKTRKISELVGELLVK